MVVWGNLSGSLHMLSGRLFFSFLQLLFACPKSTEYPCHPSKGIIISAHPSIFERQK
jgi:hypothetical protein